MPESEAKVIAAFRIGDRYTLERPPDGGVRVRIELAEDVNVRTVCWGGSSLLYREGFAFGQTVTGALKLGWCRILAE